MGKIDWALIIIIVVGIAIGIIMGGGMFLSKTEQKEKLLTENSATKIKRREINRVKTGNLENHY